MEGRNERDRDPDKLEAKHDKAIRAFIDFLVRHPERRKQFIRDVVNAGARGEVVEQVINDQDLFVTAVLGDHEETKGDLTAAGLAARPDDTER